jgi:hypothetical protein
MHIKTFKHTAFHVAAAIAAVVAVMSATNAPWKWT